MKGVLVMRDFQVKNHGPGIDGGSLEQTPMNPTAAKFIKEREGAMNVDKAKIIADLRRDEGTVPHAYSGGFAALLEHGMRRRLLKRPASKNPRAVSRYRNAVVPRDVPPRSTIRRERNIALINRLLGLCGPSAVGWRISRLVVSALYGEIIAVAVRVRPRGEWFKSLPILADGNALSPVADSLFVRAPRLHSLPDSMESRSGLPVGSQVLASQLRRKTTARARATRSKVLAVNNRDVSALALAEPQSRTASRISVLPDGKPATESLPGQVFKTGVCRHA
jgi:hypothetical protein